MIALLVATAAFPQTSESSSRASRGIFWTGLALGIAGVVTSVVAVTDARVEDSSSGNAPRGTYQACVAQRAADPIYASNSCDALNAKNVPMLWSGVAAGTLGDVLMICGSDTRAEITTDGFRLSHTVKFSTGSERTSLDGADVTDPHGGDIFAVNLNYDAIQDVEVKALGAEASDDSSMVGQYMNIVTKSGGNQFHGSAALFVIPQSFNGSNVEGIPANRREDYQPVFTLRGPIARDRIWFFTAYRRVQTDQTFNNAVVPVQRRGSLWFAKLTTQLRNDHRLQVSFLMGF